MEMLNSTDNLSQMTTPTSSTQAVDKDLEENLPGLCTGCWNLFKFCLSVPRHACDPTQFDRHKTYFYPFSHIYKNFGEETCRLCMCIARNINYRSITVDKIRSSSHEGVTVEVMSTGSKSVVALTWVGEHADAHSFHMEIEETLGLFKALEPISLQTDDPSTWKTILAWLESCSTLSTESSQMDKEQQSDEAYIYNPELWQGYWQELHANHHNCNLTIMEKKLPSRLMDVQELEPDVRLIATAPSSDNRDMRYAALSHCWGSPTLMPPRTLQSHVQKMPHDISHNSLSKTFQDAITITRKLGLRYLWIDSLCIVQDDEADWSQESIIMGNIYANCYVNIVASDAANSSVGCFFHRFGLPDLGFRITLHHATLESLRDESTESQLGGAYSTYSLASTLRLCSDRIVDPIFTCSVSMSGTLRTTSQRAWCYQETFLAPRSIYFARDQVYWRCRQLQACESVPEGSAVSPLEACSRLEVENTEELENELEIWCRIVIEYSRRQLTFARDCLPALSGIARAMYNKSPCLAERGFISKERQGGLNYLAGLWNNHKLESQLFWYCDTGSRPRSKSQNAPTWSWASVNGAVKFFRGWQSMSRSFHIISAEVSLATDDEYGVVTGGRLELECRALCSATVVQSEKLCWLSIHGIEYKVLEVKLDEPLSSMEVLCMHGLYEEDASLVQDAGLLLQPTETKDTFRRVGQYAITAEDFKANKYHERGVWKLLLPSNSRTVIFLV